MKTPKKMIQSPDFKRKASQSNDGARKIPKIESPTKTVKIYPSSCGISQNENSPQKSNSFSGNSEINSFTPKKSFSSPNYLKKFNLKNHELSPQKLNSSMQNFGSVENLKMNSFTPKKSPRSLSNQKFIGKYSPRKLFGDTEIPDITRNVIDNLNMVKQGAIGPNNFNLETIYSTNNYQVHYNCLRTDPVNEFELNDVIFPKETHADHLFSIITDVFSNIINCGYFDEREVDFVFSCLCMSAKAQMLLARLLKRKRSWHRVNSIQYPEIDTNLNIYFNELIDKGFCVSSEFLFYLNLLEMWFLKRVGICEVAP